MMLRFLLLLLLLLPALADAAPPLVKYRQSAFQPYTYHDDLNAACEQFAQLRAAAQNYTHVSIASCAMSGNNYNFVIRVVILNSQGEQITQGDFNAGYRTYVCYEAPTVEVSSNHVCQSEPPPPCTAGEVVSSGLYNIGTQANGAPPLFACQDSCEVQFDGVTPSKTQIINGVTHYFADGEYYKTGESCMTGDAPPGGGSLPPPTCAPGQAPGTINNQFVCIDQGTQQPVNPNTPQDGGDTHTDPPPGDGEPCTPGSQTKTINYPDGSRKIITTTTNADCSTETNTQNIPGPTGGNQAGNDGNGDGEPTPGSGSGGGGSTGDGEGDGDEEEEPIDSGEATIPADLYQPQSGEKTFDSIISDFADRVQEAPFYSAAASFFDISIPGGGCGGLGGSFAYGGSTFVVDLDSVFCSGEAASIYNVLGVVVLFVASLLAFRIAFL